VTPREPADIPLGVTDQLPPSAPAEPRSARVSEQLWHDVHDRLTAFVARRVDDPADVADLVQTVFLRAHQHVTSLADEERLLPWLFQITRNAIADYYRSPARRREIGGVTPDGALGLPDAHQIEPITSSSSEPGAYHLPATASDDAAALRELAGCVRPLVQHLPPPYRDALTLVEFEGQTAYGGASQIPFHVSSADWQESDRVFAGLLTAFGVRTRAIPIGVAVVAYAVTTHVAGQLLQALATGASPGRRWLRDAFSLVPAHVIGAAVSVLWPSLSTWSGASGAICWMTDILPSALAPSSPSEVPPRMPPEPLVVDEIESGAK